MNKGLLGLTALLGSGIAIPMFFPDTFYNSLQLNLIPASQTGNLLAQLIFYALIIERITEIFVDTSFSSQKAGIEAQYVNEKEGFETASRELEETQLAKDSPEYKTLVQEMNDSKSKFDLKKINSKINQQWSELTEKIRISAIVFSISVGILLALVGVRILGVLVDPIANEAVSDIPFQNTLRNGTDVMITGLLLAGGAAGLHPIINQLKRFGYSKK